MISCKERRKNQLGRERIESTMSAQSEGGTRLEVVRDVTSSVGVSRLTSSECLLHKLGCRSEAQPRPRACGMVGRA